MFESCLWCAPRQTKIEDIDRNISLLPSVKGRAWCLETGICICIVYTSFLASCAAHQANV